jgi:protein-S-isoprenylcysteine O-methyltransferase Ste14
MLFAAVGLAAWLLGRAVPLRWPGLDDLPARAVGYGFGVAGVLLVVWSAATLWRARTTVRPDRAAVRLVTTGPYRYGRNPIYAGDTMLLLGFAQLTLNVWFVIAAAVFLLAVLTLAVIPEERHLETLFGDEYRTYRERTRRWI